jgi:hypothetical protein
MSLILGILASSGGAAVAASSYESIATVTVGANQSTITFSSIATTWTHLQIRGIARNGSPDSAGNDNIRMRFNSDTGSNYSLHYLYGTGSSALAGAGANQSIMLAGKPASGGDGSNIFGAFVTDILEYKNTNIYKTIRTLTGIDNNGSGIIFFSSGNWRNTNAITTITLTSDADFTSYSSFALYGIKGV